MIFFIMDISERYARLEDRSDIALLKDVSYGNMEAFDELMNRYLDIVSRTSFRVLCDRNDSESITTQVFVFLWHNVLDYDDRYSVGEWLLSKTFKYCRLRLVRRRILSIFGVENDVFVNVSPRAENVDDYITKQAWELHCRTASHMNSLQSAVYALCVLEGMSEGKVSLITGANRLRVESALHHAEEKVRSGLKSYGKGKDYDRYNSFLRKIADSLTDMNKLKKMIIFAV